MSNVQQMCITRIIGKVVLHALTSTQKNHSTVASNLCYSLYVSRLQLTVGPFVVFMCQQTLDIQHPINSQQTKICLSPGFTDTC